MKLTAENVSKIFEDCLFKNNEITDGKPNIDPAVGQGILNQFGFHPIRLAAHKAEVIALLDNLPDEFKQSKGGGMSFLNACMTKDGIQWGEHVNMEQLFALGEALKIVKYPMPREMWHILPGGVPYITIIDKEKQDEKV